MLSGNGGHRSLSRAVPPRSPRQWPSHAYYAAAGAWRERSPERRGSIVVNGAPRSGTTWLADIAVALTGWPLMQEPSHPPRVPEMVDGVGWDGRPFREPDEADPVLAEMLERLCTGTYLGANLIFRSRANDLGLWRRRPMVTKHITLNLLLPWMAVQMPWLRTVQIVRHPLEVVASQEGRRDSYWATTTTLSRPYSRFMDAHPEYRAPREHETTAEALVTMWAIEHAWLRDTAERLGGLHWVRYEALRAQPAEEADRLADWADVARPAGAVRAGLARPSRTVEPGATTLGGAADDAWRERYDEGRRERLVAVLERFDFPFYGPDTLR